MSSAARELFSELIDFAGLFPPAGQTMRGAVESFAAHRASAWSYMVSRFVCPASRLEEFASEARRFWEGGAGGGGDGGQGGGVWVVSAIVDGDLGKGLDAVAGFNRAWAHPPRGCALVDSVEIKVARPEEVDGVVEGLADQLLAYVEFPLDQDPRAYAAALAGSGVGAKLRTGGISEGAIPGTERVAGALSALAVAGVAFKATAGLHHPVRSEQNLTYEAGCARAVMHGFVNVFFAACALHARQTDADGARRIMSETDARAFSFGGSWASWKNVRVSAQRIAAARDTFCHSFGSCSFEEPVADLTGLGWL